MKELLFVSGNAHKVEEVQHFLQGIVHVKGLKDVGLTGDIEETATTLEGNAALKARFAWDRLHIPCFADDTGLEVAALHGAPGVYSARYASPKSDAVANRLKLLTEMDGHVDRTAAFHTVICLVLGGTEYFFHGRIEGTIQREERGQQGFGYDSLFVPNVASRTFAEMS
ncbi:MAG: non-canonical purine NTP pyrophosphatase, partial [Flavobacteriales bacterium]|nr:non-canonical purine NTP pyrophosphatase [Flavobacteriales bacterium]